jgi:hypothetical protein
MSVASATITPRTVPGTPTGVAGAAGNGQVSLSWSAPPSDGGASISDYVVEISSNGGPGVHGYRVDIDMNGTKASFRDALISANWDVKVWPWKIDPLKDLEGWRKEAAGEGVYTATTGALQFMPAGASPLASARKHVPGFVDPAGCQPNIEFKLPGGARRAVWYSNLDEAMKR